VDVCDAGPYSVARFTTANVCSPLSAKFNTTYQAPACGSGCGCDTVTLIRGRGAMSGGYETNSPNTLLDSCADGNAGVFHADESIDKMLLATPDKSLIVPGAQVKLDVSVWCRSSTDKVDLYYTTNAASPSWSLLSTQSCTGSGAKTISQTFTVGSATGDHAIRAQIRYGGLAGTCVAGGYNERDDLVFNVAAPVTRSAPAGLKTQGRSQPGH
jgi:hypothetical protein